MTVRSLFDRTFHDTVKDGTNDEGGPSGGVSWEGGGCFQNSCTSSTCSALVGRENLRSIESL